jgi:hypothetical protein
VSLFVATKEIKQCFRPKVKHCLSYAPLSDNQGMLEAADLAKRIVKAMDEADPPVLGVELAAACSVTPQAVSGWRRTGRVGKGHLTTIARLTGKSLEYFVGEGVTQFTKNGVNQPWLLEKVLDPEQFNVVFRTWQDARSTDRENLVAIAKAARKAHGTRRKRTG